MSAELWRVTRKKGRGFQVQRRPCAFLGPVADSRTAGLGTEQSVWSGPGARAGW